MAKHTKPGLLASKSGSSFHKQLNLALGHFQDPEWLGLNSPLAAPYFLGQQLARQSFDQSSEGRGRILQSLLRQTSDDLTFKGGDGVYARQLIDLRFIHPKSFDYILDTLNIGRATYYRHEAKAIELLADAIIRRINPAMHLESPFTIKRFVGRARLLEENRQALHNRQTVVLQGKSGVGKTTLGARVASEWQPQPPFWYAFKLGLNDHLSSLLYSLGCFLNGYGASNLWLQAVADRVQTGPSVALGLLLHDLRSLDQVSPLLCFDDVDVLKPEESESHAQIVSFLASLHLRVPILIISQLTISQRMFESDLDFTVPNFNREEVVSLFMQNGASVSESEVDTAISYTDGNPRLLSLLVALHRTGGSVLQALEILNRSPSTESLFASIFQRLSSAERKMLKGLSVFHRDAPSDAWDGRTLQALTDRGLIQESVGGGITLPPTIRNILLSKMLPEEREKYHLLAAQITEMRAEYTTAAYHYLKGGQAGTGLQLWRIYKEQEIDQGKASEALSVFEQIAVTQLQQPEQEALVLTRSELKMLLGQIEQSAADLNTVTWSQNSLWSLLANELRGSLALARNQLTVAASELTAGIQSAMKLNVMAVSLHRNLSTVLRRSGNYPEAWRELLLAQCEVANAQGFLKYLLGEYGAAQAYFESTLDLATAQGFSLIEAKIRSNYADLLKVLSDYEAAIRHLETAIRYYESVGDIINTAFVKSNLAAVYVEAQQPGQALTPAHEALVVCQNLHIPVGVARASQVLAEAYLLLGNLPEAEKYAGHSIEVGLETYTPYSLLTLAEVRLRQANTAEAEALCHQSILQAKEINDRNLEGLGQRTLGMVCARRCDWLKAGNALRSAIEVFEELNLPQEVVKTQTLLAQTAQEAGA